MNFGRVLPVAAMLLFSIAAQGEWVKGEAEIRFGPDLTENEACKRASQKAQQIAMRAISGEMIFADEAQVCGETVDSSDCSLNQFTWSTINGVITGVRNEEQKTVTIQDGYRSCAVSLEANVQVGSGKPDPSFDMTVRLNRLLFRHGEAMEITIEPTQPMYINVFQWFPYDDSGQAVLRFFPNIFDRNSKFLESNTIPTINARALYDVRIVFPKNVKKYNRADEYLMIIGTREKIKFRETYTLNEFKARLLEIPRHDSREVKKAYTVVKME
jgi:hypothetical protein